MEVRGNSVWFIDSACSSHMTGNRNYLTSLHTQAEGGHVSFENKTKGAILGTGEIKLNKSTKVCNVNLVKDLGYNLLSVAQMCDQGNNVVTFDSQECFSSEQGNQQTHTQRKKIK